MILTHVSCKTGTMQTGCSPKWGLSPFLFSPQDMNYAPVSPSDWALQDKKLVPISPTRLDTPGLASYLPHHTGI